MYLRHIILFLYAVAFVCHLVAAQRPYFQQDRFSYPASEIKHVTGIAADKNNCIWFATQTGIYRYDGTNFRHYSVLNNPVLKFERMTTMVLRSNNRGDNWCMRDNKNNLYEIDSLSHFRSFSAQPGLEEKIIYAKNSYPVLHPDRDSIAPSLRDSIFESYVTPVSNRAFLLLINGKVVSMPATDLLRGSRGPVIHSFKGSYEYREVYGTKTFVTRDNFYVISGNSLTRWEGNSEQPQKVELAGDILAAGKIVYDDLIALKTTTPGLNLLWYAGNIYETNETGNSRILSTRLLIKDTDKELPAAIFYSPAQQLFISYYFTKGLVFYRPIQFNLLTGEAPGSPRIPSDYYYSLLPANGGFITINDAAIVWLGVNGERREIHREPCFKYFMFRDRRGNTWYNSRKNETICYLDAASGKPVEILKTGPQNVLCGIYQSNDSTYYLLTNHSFKKILLKNGTVASIQNLYTAPAGVEYNVLYAASEHTLWLGSDKGLLEFSISGNAIKEMTSPGNVYVRAIIKLAENNYLLGTYDKGIYQFRNGRWSHLSSLGKNMPASAHAFLIDRTTSSLWVSSNEGILRFSLDQLTGSSHARPLSFGHFTKFGPDISPEFNGSSNISGAMLSDTCLAFANANGLVVFNPSKLIYYPLPVNVLIESSRENNPDSSSGNSVRSRHIEFYPVVPYFGNLDELEILYRLTNSDESWHKLSPNSAISYNNLQPGDHDLQFQIRHYHDAEDKKVFLTAKSFTVPYRWYERSWFIVALAVFMLLLFVFLHYLRIWYILKRRRELEKLVKIKTSELQETNENLVNVINELSLSEANLKQSNFLKDEYYAVLTHDLRSPLKFLSFNINRLLEFLPEMKHEALKKGLYAAYECSNDVYKLIDEFVYWIQDNEKQLRAQPSLTVVGAVIEDAKRIYAFSLEENKNRFITDIPAGLVFITDPKLLFIILRNAIDNANKYTSDGTITVSARIEKANLEVIVADTGRGISEDKARHLMELQHGNVQLSYKQRKSLGFYIMAMLTRILGGHYTIGSTKENGTSLCFTFPALKEHEQHDE